MKTITKTATKPVATPVATKPVATLAVTPQGIRAPIYGFIIGLAAGKQGQAASNFLSRAKSHHKNSGMTFPRTPFAENVHAKMSDDAINSGLDAWRALVNAGQGRKLAGSAFSQALYDAYRVVYG